MTQEVKLRAGQFLIPVKITEKNNRLEFDFPYNLILKDEIKAMKGSKFHGFDPVPRKIWSVQKCQRNQFQLDYLQYSGTERDPYKRYDEPLKLDIFPKERYNASKQKILKLFDHTPEMAAHLVQRRQCILAGEMGTAKTIACILGLEHVGQGKKILYVAPRSALRAVEREFSIWQSKIKPDFMTYEALTKYVKNSEEEDIDYDIIVLDESSKVKNHTSQRSQAAQIVADKVRERNGYVWLMSGSPAPKSPQDWWSQAEIACPGFLKEGDIYKFKNRLAIITQKTDQTGGSYPVLVGWKDNEKKCNICGLEQIRHLTDTLDHAFIPSKNEVQILYGRLKGLVYIKFKKDCLDLPDKNYRVVELKPTQSILRVAKSIPKICKTSIEALTKLRELSDGFQYQETKDGLKECDLCKGTGQALQPEVPEHEGYHIPTGTDEPKMALKTCPNCLGKGKVDKLIRTYKEIPCPKDDYIVDLLDEYEDVGRVVIYAGFTASIDRVVKQCLKQQWAVIRVDQGKDTIYDSNGTILKDDYLRIFQDALEEYPRVAFVAHPDSAGMGLTLTASPVIAYYSNDFNAESRIQSEDRIHRAGMDVNRGATIIDLIHLPSDTKILDNLKKKRQLQSITLGEVNSMLESTETVER